MDPEVFLQNILILRRKSAKLKRLIYRRQMALLFNMIKVNSVISMRLLNVKNRRLSNVERSSVYWEVEVKQYDEDLFKESFGMTRQSFQLLVSKLNNLAKSDTEFRDAIPLDKRVAACLYSLRSSAEYRTVSSLFGIDRTTLGEMVLEFCEEVYSVLSKSYLTSYPPTRQKLNEIVSGFETLGYPQCYGAIDGCHIKVPPPKENAIDYYNFKGWYSTILFAAADHKCRFTYINVGATGRDNDSSIFENSLLKKAHESLPIFFENYKQIGGVDVPIHLIGDSAFRLTEIVMKPYPFVPNQDPAEKCFNYHLSKCRRVIENAFGQLKGRFRKVGRGLEVHVDNAYKIIRATCVLHNFCVEQKDSPHPSWIEENNNDFFHRNQPHQRRCTQGNTRGVDIRNALKNYFNADVDGIANSDPAAVSVSAATGILFDAADEDTAVSMDEAGASGSHV